MRYRELLANATPVRFEQRALRTMRASPSRTIASYTSRGRSTVVCRGGGGIGRGMAVIILLPEVRASTRYVTKRTHLNDWLPHFSASRRALRLIATTNETGRDKRQIEADTPSVSPGLPTGSSTCLLLGQPVDWEVYRTHVN